MPNTPLNKEELSYNPREYGKSFKAWQVFINASRSGESAVYKTPEGDICSPERVKQIVDAAVREARVEEQLEGKQQAWNHIWDAWLKGDDDDFDDFMRQYNAELWPPESQPNAKEETNER